MPYICLYRTCPTMLNFIRPNIRAARAYAVADLPAGWLKLDAMEVPYAFPPELQSELAAQLARADINRYPNPAASALPAALRRAFPVPDTAALALGNGSDELIQFITLLFARTDAKMLVLEPSFVMYRRNAELFGMDCIGVPLKPDFTLDLPAVLNALAEHNPALIFLAYPNNPTGVPFARADVEAVIAAASGAVVVDEAYGAFSRDSFLPQAGQPENLIVLRTLSKIGFAGLRLGYAAGAPAVMNELAKILPPYNMNCLSLTAAEFALNNMDFINKNIELLKQERTRLSNALRGIAGATVFASEANFITVRLPDAEAAYQKLLDNKILVKKLHGSHALLNNCLRLTIGTPEQNDAVLSVLLQAA
ncbi:histidinol-phosphate transaminase [Conchiformibius kuhniae]|uniref:Histidinol-phosphate aminotransferase n=1 Tax=Conchiformibius kuhniae TaxID=211502 RepID=A0A8T9MTV5_9NEIS|nr:histidinol-phosphate transaminase [Conchiformibius kuhniae]UOP04719.1 histidinol-phosphate transaminase [Conchiformibius kuhniae]